MLFVLGIAAVIWGIGVLMKVPRRQRLILIGVLWVLVVIEHLVLPEGHPLRLATGGSAQVWLSLGLVAAVIAAYRAGLGRLRQRARPAP